MNKLIKSVDDGLQSPQIYDEANQLSSSSAGLHSDVQSDSE